MNENLNAVLLVIALIVLVVVIFYFALKYPTNGKGEYKAKNRYLDEDEEVIF